MGFFYIFLTFNFFTTLAFADVDPAKSACLTALGSTGISKEPGYIEVNDSLAMNLWKYQWDGKVIYRVGNGVKALPGPRETIWIVELFKQKGNGATFPNSLQIRNAQRLIIEEIFSKISNASPLSTEAIDLDRRLSVCQDLADKTIVTTNQSNTLGGYAKFLREKLRALFPNIFKRTQFQNNEPAT